MLLGEYVKERIKNTQLVLHKDKIYFVLAFNYKNFDGIV